MKRFAFVPILILLIAAFVLCGCAEKKPDGSLPAGATEYKLSLSISADLTAAELNESVTYRNSTGTELSELVFNLYPNSYSEHAKNSAYFAELSRYGEIKITSVSIAGKPLEWTLAPCGTIMTVKLDTPLEADGVVTLDIGADLIVPECNLRFGVSEGILNMTGFYPVLAVYENGAFRKDEYCKVGDPFYQECAAYTLTLDCPAELVVAVGADEVKVSAQANGRQTVTAASACARDIAFSCSKDFKLLSAACGDVTVNYYYTGETAPEDSLNTAVSALSTFNEAIGAYSGKTYSLVETDYYYGGMEYPYISYINKNATDKNEVIIHETAHQWFGLSVGSDAINNAWQDEALVTFLSNYYYALNGDNAKYATLRDEDKDAYNSYIKTKRQTQAEYSAVMDASIYTFSTNYEYSMVVYTKGSLMFDAVYQLTGDTKMKRALSQYYADNAGKIATPKALYDAFASVGRDVTPICRAWLTDGVVFATFAEQ